MVARHRLSFSVLVVLGSLLSVNASVDTAVPPFASNRDGLPASPPAFPNASLIGQIETAAADLGNSDDKIVCEKETGSTCFLNACDAWRNATCSRHLCVCDEASCADHGACVPKSRHFFNVAAATRVANESKSAVGSHPTQVTKVVNTTEATHDVSTATHATKDTSKAAHVIKDSPERPAVHAVGAENASKAGADMVGPGGKPSALRSHGNKEYDFSADGVPLAIPVDGGRANGTVFNSSSPHLRGGVTNHSDEPDCAHGEFNRTTKRCHCHGGWRISGVTDAYHWIEGVCDQYQCVSDESCVEALRIDGAQCPIHGWNCYCGWTYAFSNMLSGYESKGRKGGKCMGVMYASSTWVTLGCMSFVTHAYKVFFLIAFLLLPFGRKRANCDHHRPSLWNGLRNCANMRSTCQGECVLNPQYSFEWFKDDIAWSLYVFDVGVWAHLFVFALWCITLSLWAFLLLLIVVVALVVAACIGLLGVCGAAGGGGGDMACLDASTCGDCGCMNGCTDACCGDACCASCCGGGGGGADGALAMYAYGPFPYDPFWGSVGMGGYTGGGASGSTHGSDSTCLCSRNLCRPIALLAYVFPVAPENAWGGVAGYLCFGTHQLTPPHRLYSGGSPVIEFMRMGWRRSADLHDDVSWRLQVHNFLSGDAGTEADGNHGIDTRWGQDVDVRGRRMPEEALPFLMQDGVRRRVLAVGQAHAVCVERGFDVRLDECVESSYEDYKNNECWICRGENQADEWDMWTSCHHMFCKCCSTEMLRRRMPCPLCRVASSTVIRGLARRATVPRSPNGPQPPPRLRTNDGDDEGTYLPPLQEPPMAPFRIVPRGSSTGSASPGSVSAATPAPLLTPSEAAPAQWQQPPGDPSPFSDDAPTSVEEAREREATWRAQQAHQDLLAARQADHAMVTIIAGGLGGSATFDDCDEDEEDEAIARLSRQAQEAVFLK